jgi:hypothetical protein
MFQDLVLCTTTSHKPLKIRKSNIVLMNILDWSPKRVIMPKSLLISVAIVLLTTAASQSTFVNVGHAETGKGTDVFKVIMSIFGVDESIGDIVAIVTVNNQEAKVKFFDASGPSAIPLNASEGGGNLIEYVATFPNVTVNSGDEYKGCVLGVKDLEILCKTGYNSPAYRPEFIDINLDDVTTAAGGTEQSRIGETIENVEEAEPNRESDNDDD